MPNFPGIALIIDELFDLAYLPLITDNPAKAIQQKSFIDLKYYLQNNGISFATITNTNDIVQLKKRINSYDNVRLLILDLDLNDDGEVGEDDDYLTIFLILQEALNKFGYFFLLINSAHAEKWDEIKKVLPIEINIFSAKKSPVDTYDKSSEISITDKLTALKTNNFSLELIYDFECFLNTARDKAFQGIIDFEKRTWNKIYKQIHNEAGSYANFIVSDLLLSLIKQHMIGDKYSIPTTDDPINVDIAKKAFVNANYISNANSALSSQPIWTGNLYHIENPVIPHLQYAVIITPECDISQGKFLHYQIVCGYEFNESTFPVNYHPDSYTQLVPPIHVLKSGMSKGKWKAKDNLQNKNNFIEHLYTLPFCSINDKTVILDFRDITFVTSNRISTYKLIRRVGDPVLTDLLNKISGIFNRKGLPPFLPSNINPLGY
jgi:hypothetical protein